MLCIRCITSPHCWLFSDNTMSPSALEQFLAHCSEGQDFWTQQNFKFCSLHIFNFVLPSSGALFHSAQCVWSQCSCAVLLCKSKSCHDCELQTESKVRRKVWIQQLLLLMRMSNLIRGWKKWPSCSSALKDSRTLLQNHIKDRWVWVSSIRICLWWPQANW